MVEYASLGKDQTWISILTQLRSLRGKLFTSLSVSFHICERGITTVLLSEATVSVTSPALGPSGFPISIKGATLHAAAEAKSVDVPHDSSPSRILAPIH